ncbi:MAG: OmpA family protein [Pseudoxanthomonas sp.]
MGKSNVLSCVVLSLLLAACQQSNGPDVAAQPSSSMAATAQAAAPTPAATTAATGVEAPPVDLLAFALGTQIVEKPKDNQGLFQMGYDPINLIDEAASTDWTASAKPLPVLVFEFPEQTEVERMVFDSAGLNRDEKSPKSVTVEMSDTSKDDGYKTILTADLAMARNDQSVPVSARVPGRWLRLTINSNHGDEYVGMTGVHAYGRQLTSGAALSGVSGTYEGWSGWGKVRLKQEGTRVTGCYEYQDGTITGGIEGRLLKAVMTETGSDGARTRQLGLFSFSHDGKLIMGLTRAEGAEAGSGYASFYNGEKVSDDLGNCPNVPGWKGNTAQSQLGDELQALGRARLDGINFDFSSAKLRAESEPLLKQVASLLNAHPDWQITLEGHTDSVGGAAYNRTLSEQRAAAVVAYLVSQGIAAERLQAVGFGMDQPVASNDGEAGRAQNRRVEIVKR